MGISQKLRHGSKQIDQWENDIKDTVSIIVGNLVHDDFIAFESPKVWRIQIEEGFWKFSYENKRNVDIFEVEFILFFPETKGKREKQATVFHWGKVGNRPIYMELQSRYTSTVEVLLDYFSGGMIELFPQLNDRLEPYLYAGKSAGF